jgi:hypothetical protein
MDHVSDNMAAVIFVLVLFGAPVTAWIVSRVLAHQERMAMIARGMVPPPGAVNGFGSKMPPPAWTAGPPPPPPGVGKRNPYPAYDDYYYAQTQMRKGIRLALIGFALFIGLGGIGPVAGISYFGPWLLGGLVPMFIGIAQIVNAVLNGAQIPGFTYGAPHQSGTFTPPPPPPPGGAPPPQAPPGPYAWRPGPTPEIERHDK